MIIADIKRLESKVRRVKENRTQGHTSRLGHWSSMPEIRDISGVFVEPYVCLVDLRVTAFTSGSYNVMVSTCQKNNSAINIQYEGAA
jgi:hypothetical protein